MEKLTQSPTVILAEVDPLVAAQKRVAALLDRLNLIPNEELTRPRNLGEQVVRPSNGL